MTAIAAAFGGASGGGGESGSIFDGVNSALGGFAAGGSDDDEVPPAYLSYILFDQQYKVLDAGWKRVPTSANFAKQKVTLDPQYITEAGYYFTYLSYEGESNNYVYFDDYKVRHVKSRLIQGNEYYPFGLQTANSWTREAVTGNNYLANGGTELNQTSQLYDLHYRNYDPALGRMFQIDPMASKYGSLTPYNYSLNNPANLSDPLGDDVEPQPAYPREYLCAMCWREGDNQKLYMMMSGGGLNSVGSGWRVGGGGMAGYLSYSDGARYGWNPNFAGPVAYTDATGAQRYGTRTILEMVGRQGPQAPNASDRAYIANALGLSFGASLEGGLVEVKIKKMVQGESTMLGGEIIQHSLSHYVGTVFDFGVGDYREMYAGISEALKSKESFNSNSPSNWNNFWHAYGNVLSGMAAVTSAPALAGAIGEKELLSKSIKYLSHSDYSARLSAAKEFNKILGGTGKILGITGTIASFGALVTEDFSWTNASKFGISLGSLALKANPVGLVISLSVGIADATGLLDHGLNYVFNENTVGR